MSEIIPSSPRTSSSSSKKSLLVSDRRVERQLRSIERRAIARTAKVRGDAAVQAEKANEVDRLVREAMTGQAMLSQWAATLAQGDPFVADELKFFTDLARAAKGEIVADAVRQFSQEGRS